MHHHVSTLIMTQPNLKLTTFILQISLFRCAPCRKIAPIFEKLSKDHVNLQFVKIDIDEYPAMATEFKVSSVPTFFFISGKNKISEVKKYIMTCCHYDY